MTLTDTQIALLIAARNKITDVMVHDDISTDTREIDAVLSEVPAGYNNTVDLLLGRRCAKLPQRKAQQAAPMLELDPVCAALLAQHDAEVAERKANGGKRYGGMTYTAFLDGMK